MDFEVVDRVVKVDVFGIDKLVLDVDGKKEEIDVKAFLTIDDSDVEVIQAQITADPANYAYYASVLNWYQYREDQITNEMEELLAQSDLDYRKDPRNSTCKEREFKSLLETDPKIIKKREEVAKIHYVVKKLSLFVRAVEKKGDRLVQVYSRLKFEEGKHTYL